jgi:hypothetical protein
LSDTAAPQASAVADRASQTLHRALDILEAVAEGAHSLKAFEARVGLTRSTTHRLASALVDRGLLSAVGRDYRLGGRLVQLGHQAQRAAGPGRGGAAHAGRAVGRDPGRDQLWARSAGDEVLYVGQIARTATAGGPPPGRRPQPCIRDTALGRALLIDAPPARWAAAVRRRIRPRRRSGGLPARDGGRAPDRPRAAPGGRSATASAASPPRSAAPAARSSPPSACPACRSTWTRRGWPSWRPSVAEAALEIGGALGFNPARLNAAG